VELSWDLDPNNTNNSINGRVQDDSRLARWKAVLNTIKNSPILGHGSGSEKLVLQDTYRENSLNVSLERMYNTHSQFLFFGLEYGILGIILFFCYLGINLYNAIKRNDLFIIHFIVWITLICCFENYFNRTMGVLLMSIALTFMKTGDEKSNVNI
jgi:O-antigen ligase